MDEYRVKYMILGVAYELSPTGKEQKAFVELSNNPNTKPEDLLAALLDGIRYGNWPKWEGNGNDVQGN